MRRVLNLRSAPVPRRLRNVATPVLLGVAISGAVWFVGLAAFLLLSRNNATDQVPLTEAVYEGTKLDGPAPDFRLVDHKGSPLSLSAFRGKVVVLAFMDARCDETCPLTAQQFRWANRALGDTARQVVFLGVNVNTLFHTPDDVARFTEEQGLGEIASWHFLTGTPEQLSAVWAAYSIEVRAKPGEDDFEHTPGVFIIDKGGNLRWYVSVPLLDEELVAPWAGPSLHELLVKHILRLLEE